MLLAYDDPNNLNPHRREFVLTGDIQSFGEIHSRVMDAARDLVRTALAGSEAPRRRDQGEITDAEVEEGLRWCTLDGRPLLG